MSALAAPLAAALSRVLALPPVAYLASLSRLGWLGVFLGSTLLYAHNKSTLAKRPANAPCPEFGTVMRILYGLFGMRIGEMVLSQFNHTKAQEIQAEQVGGTLQKTVGEPELRIKIVPILGSLFGGNYAFMIWDEADTERRAICVDPADPEVLLRAAKQENLKLHTVLTTHWHWDHSGGNRALAKALPGLQVLAGAGERGFVPAVTRRLRDEEEVQVGSITVRGHAVPGHTHGSTVYEVFSTRAAAGTPSSVFTGDSLFCGGCGALFECSATTLHTSLRKLVSRLPASTRVYPGHEYTEMLLRPLAAKRPRHPDEQRMIGAAQKKLLEVMEWRARKEPSIPSTMAEELTYNQHLLADPAQLAQMCGAVER